MFQTFDATTRPGDGPARLDALRRQLSVQGLDGYLVPRSDAYQGEYVTPHYEVLAWLTAFTGSAGFCAVLPGIAGVFVDGRYRVQVKTQVDLAHFTPVDWPEIKLAPWLKEHLPGGGVVGFDPWLHTKHEIDQLVHDLKGSGIEMRRHDAPLVKLIWPDRPAEPDAPITPFPTEFAGEEQHGKRRRIGRLLADAGQDHAILTLPDSISWLLNIRGADVPRNPVVQAFAILAADGTLRLYRRNGRRHAELEPMLAPGVTVLPEGMFDDDIRALRGTVRCDPKTAPFEVSLCLTASAATPVWADDPCILSKAMKSPTEIAASREAHLRDGAAMVEFLAWLDTEAPKAGLTEIDVVRALEGFRRATNNLRDISFDTICGSGPNGAIVHYRVTEDSNRPVRPGELLLVDSGGQYLDGTTDITRTVAIGAPTDDQRAVFTRVLQGMIAISRLRWPKGVAGQHLDAFARAALWAAGQDYDHGTGHGVGVYLSVHEGPQRLSRLSDVVLQAGMILSNEPGYYREGEFGIRIENLVVVNDAEAIDGGDAHRRFHRFETLTYVPIDRRLIDADALAAPERAWLDAYHGTVFEKLGPRVSAEALAWLATATAPL